MQKLFLVIILLCSLGYAKKSMVVLDPAAIEILYMIGAEDEIVAIPEMKNIKPIEKTNKLDKIGTFTNPNLEKIISLKPKRVILTSYSIGLKDQLERYKIETLQLPVSTLKDIYKNILTLGKLTNKEYEAKKVAQDFMSKIEEIRANPVNQKGVFIYSSTPLMVFGGDTLPSDILETIGVENIAKDIVGERPILSAEFLVGKNPDIIFYGLRIKDRDELVKANQSFKFLKAIQENKVYFLELHTLLRGSPEIINQILRIQHDLAKNIEAQ
ncbi:ABC transporter substrate-binding protein [Helicobacter didelphidarum]|uniref:ABC transporter substrate-binding protein n=1 Tax=Helicobacter didelphidarum TaxID=2040648 RepID=A0A3D8IHU7_9HELI|nr:ABC transporter substrate-binding protein [Helicobacter didelphidarum]RDU64224.1 ABC transporter substrate-binding protein [Helicobacter didelphidarum]